MLVGTALINDAVHIETCRHRLVDLAQERQKLPVPVTRLAGGQCPPLSTFRAANGAVVP